ncbi:MAG TPA: hypothetical protein VMY37_07610 [Thermoguttaceae bacterium]|nr:hypothetical protein [Thermoguttaceae bacterium]
MKTPIVTVGSRMHFEGWRLCLHVHGKLFCCEKPTYPSEEAARKAARRIAKARGWQYRK